MLHKIKKIGSLGTDWLIATRTYTGFCSMKQLRVFLLCLGQDVSPSHINPLQFVMFSQQFADTHLYFWVESGTVSVKVAYYSFSKT